MGAGNRLHRLGCLRICHPGMGTRASTDCRMATRRLAQTGGISAVRGHPSTWSLMAPSPRARFGSSGIDLLMQRISASSKALRHQPGSAYCRPMRQAQPPVMISRSLSTPHLSVGCPCHHLRSHHRCRQAFLRRLRCRHRHQRRRHRQVPCRMPMPTAGADVATRAARAPPTAAPMARAAGWGTMPTNGRAALEATVAAASTAVRSCHRYLHLHLQLCPHRQGPQGLLLFPRSRLSHLGCLHLRRTRAASRPRRTSTRRAST